MSICYRPYVAKGKPCEKTDDVSEVTCYYCINMLLRAGKLETRKVENNG